MSRRRPAFRKTVEHIGLDWFILLTGKPAFEDAPPPHPPKLSEIRHKFSDLTGQEKLDYAIHYCESLLKREDDRSDKIESKAFTLIGITGIATGFITGFASLLLDREKLASDCILVPAIVLYILVAISLMWTIYLAVRVVIVGDYWFTYPSADDVLELPNTSLSYIKRERVVSLFYSFAQNTRAVNRKATFLGGAQLWFRNSIVLLLALTLFLAVYAFFAPAAPVAPSTPTATLLSTPSLTHAPAAPVGSTPTTRTPPILISTDSPVRASTATLSVTNGSGSRVTVTETP
jgi:hypothetical protein